MFKFSTNLLFFMTLILGTIMTISANSWLGAWMGLEINLLSFIPLMINNNNVMSNEASLKYFLTQALASALLLFSIIMFMIFYNYTAFINLNNNIIMFMINSTLLLKMGAAPFHFWFPGVMEGLSWFNNLILMTWQKIAPMILISYCLLPKFILVIIITSSIIGALGGLNQISLHKLMAYSSINHLGWMLAALLYSQPLWFIYFLIYTILSFSLVYLFNSFKLNNLNQTFSMFSSNVMLKFSLFLAFLSLGGLPPFLGFLPKWLVIQNMIPNYFLLFIMVMFTLITLYFYLRIFYSAIMINYWQNNWTMNINQSTMNMKMSLLFNYFSLFTLSLINIFYFI